MINRMSRVSQEMSLNPELQQVSRRLTGLSMKRPGLAFGIYGEPGIGKTHTTLELLRGAPCQTWTVHATQALEKTILQLPRPKKLTLWLEKTLERITKAEQLETGLLNQALVALLAANAPVILHVEDLHETNDTRLEFWDQLALGVTRVQGVGLIVTSRTQPPESFEAIRLSALNREESDVLLEAEAKAKLPEEALAWLFEKAVGNPLFTLEFFRFLARQGSLWNDGHLWRWRQPMDKTMPVSVEALIEQILREAANTPNFELVLGAKAMLDLNSSETLWQKITELNLEDFVETRETLEKNGLLVSGEFAHPLFREVVLGQMAREQRQGFARRALEALKGDPESVAKFLDDAELEPMVALKLLQRLVLQAKKRSNESLVGQLLARATNYAIGQEKGNLALEAAKILQNCDMKAALQLSKLACETLNDSAEAIYMHARILVIGGNIRDAQEVLLRLSADEYNSTQWLEELIAIKTLSRDGKGVIEVWEQHPEAVQQFSIATLTNISFSLMWCDQAEKALSMTISLLARQDISLQEQNDLRYVLGCCYKRLDQAEAAVNIFQDCITFSRAEYKLPRLITALQECAKSQIDINRNQEALACLNEAREVAAILGNPNSYAFVQNTLGELLVMYGEFTKAEELLLENRTILISLDTYSPLVDCEYLLSYLYRMSAFPHSLFLAERHAINALKTAQIIGHPYYVNAALRSLAAAENSNGRPERGLALAKQVLSSVNPERLADLRETYFVYAQSLAALGLSDEALIAFQKAEKAAKQIGDLYIVCLISLEIAHITHDTERARKSLAWFKEHGLMSGVNIAYRYFPELATSTTAPSSTIKNVSIPYLEVLGSMQTKLESQTTPMRGRKRQELLALLLEARVSGRGVVSKLELVEKLYPDADEIQANAGLRDVIYQLRSSLGEGALTTTANGYALGSLQTDVETFLETGNTQLWRGIYLEGLTLETSDTVRESVYLALRTRAEGLLESDPVEVTRVGRLLCEADPYDLEALRLTVTGLRSGQNHRSLSRFYDQARTRFLEIGEVLPARWQDFLTPIGTIA
jgi:tetratricopeptide (TPR) repeat protein